MSSFSALSKAEWPCIEIGRAVLVKLIMTEPFDFDKTLKAAQSGRTISGGDRYFVINTIARIGFIK